MKKYIPIAISITLVAIVGCVYITNVNSWNTSLMDQKFKIEEYENAINVQKQSIQNKQEETINSVSGIDFKRVEEDDKKAETFLSTIMTWDNYKDYENIRKKMINDYQIPEDSSFMQVFLPKIPNKKNKDGKNYNKIDNNGLNITYDSMKSYVTKITESTYSYFSVVKWSTADSDGNEAESSAVFSYDIDANGGISNLEGYTIE